MVETTGEEAVTASVLNTPNDAILTCGWPEAWAMCFAAIAPRAA